MNPSQYACPSLQKPTKQSSQNPTILTARSSNLLWSTLSSLLALDSGSLTLSGAGGGLGLLGLLDTLSSGSLVLVLLDGGLAGGGTGLWSLGSSLLDHIEGSTNDSTLGLNSTAGSLLGNFLYTQVLSIFYPCVLHPLPASEQV
jgi:hypothetical protein